MRIVFITSGSFPYGEARTNRLIAFAKGMVELGHYVLVLLINPSNQQSSNSNHISGQFNGVNFKYTTLTTSWPKYIFLKSYILLKGIFFGLLEVSQLNKTKKIDAFIILEYYPLKMVLFILFAKIHKIKIIHGYNEYPFLNQKSTIFKRLRLEIYLKWIVKKYDGVFLITKALLEYYKPYLSQKSHATVIPMTVEPDRFVNFNKASDFRFPYIAYCGSMYTNKDGLLTLIEAFGIFTKQFPEIQLVLIGDNSNVEKFSYISEKIKSLKLSKKIHLTGRVSRDEMPPLLCNAMLLTLSRPDNMQAKGGFPTKLGEYLATGKPVVVTAVGEIPQYLEDGKNAFIASPNDPIAFSKKMYEAMSDYNVAQKIGGNGQKIAYEIFNYKVQTKKLLDFINDINL